MIGVTFCNKNSPVAAYRCESLTGSKEIQRVLRKKQMPKQNTLLTRTLIRPLCPQDRFTRFLVKLKQFSSQAIRVNHKLALDFGKRLTYISSG